MSTTTETEIGRYLARVRAALADLSADERDEVLDDLEAHLAEVLDELATDPDGGTLEARLGAPEEYADELRASAGLGAGKRRGRRLELRQRLASLRAQPAVQHTLAFLPELRPGWWVLRGVIVAAVVAVAAGGGKPLTIFLALFAVPASVWFGRRTATGAWRRGGLAVTGLTAVAGGWLLLTLGMVETEYYPVDSGGSASYDVPLTGPDGPVTNIYPYAADGTPLHNVLLYDQNGNPIVLTDQGASGYGELIRQFPYTVDGRAIQHAYPQDQATEDTTTYPPTVRRQNPPRVTVPQFATPTPTGGTGGGPTATASGPAGTPTPPGSRAPTPTGSPSRSPR